MKSPCRKPEYFLMEHYELYLFNGKPYFFTWENWLLYGGFTFFYDDILEEITTKRSFKKHVLYNISLFVDRNPEDPNEWYRYQLKITEISRDESLSEVKEIAKEVRAFNCQDSDLLADILDELRQLLSPNK